MTSLEKVHMLPGCQVKGKEVSFDIKKRQSGNLIWNLVLGV